MDRALVDTLVYGAILIGHIGFGRVLHDVTSDPTNKRRVCTLVGLITIAFTAGRHTLHTFILTTVSAFIALFAPPRYRLFASIIFGFGYLTLFRLVFCDNPFANMIMMVMTLRVVGIAAELDTVFQMKDNRTPEAAYEMEVYKELSLWDIYHYSYCYIGVLAGPYYRYRTHYDFFVTGYPPLIDRWKFTWERCKILPFLFILHLASFLFTPLSYVRSDEFWLRSIWYKLWYMQPLFLCFRTRLYMGFLLGEATCLSAGLGIYPIECRNKPGQGPTVIAPILAARTMTDGDLKKLPYDHRTVTNVEISGCEQSSTVQQTIRHWNMTVQYWLANFCHRKMPWPRPVRMVATMAVSSLWHGVNPGYYLCLMSAPLFVLTEAKLLRILRTLDLKGQLYTFAQSALCLYKLEAFTYMSIPFLLLSFVETLHYWLSIWFCGHLFLLVVLVVDALWPEKKKNCEDTPDGIDNVSTNTVVAT